MFLFYFLTYNNNHTIYLKFIVPGAPLEIVHLECLHINKNLVVVTKEKNHMWYMKSTRAACMTNSKSGMHLCLKIKLNVDFFIFFFTK